jgi:predicted tellurium resistance membrane protein TerC
MELLLEPQTWIAFGTLLLLELVLGIDNIVFITILAGKLPAEQQARARAVGLGLAIITRLLLLLTLSIVIGATTPLFSVLEHAFSGRDLILLGGGLFLIVKSTQEIHQRLEGHEGKSSSRAGASFLSVILQIMVLDIVFSLDSVITAVGMVNEIPIMVAAVITAVVAMLFFLNTVSRFVNQHPTVKMLALSFLLLIGFTLVADGFGQHIDHGYIYFAIAFSLGVELLNLRTRREEEPVKLHEPYVVEHLPRD